MLGKRFRSAVLVLGLFAIAAPVAVNVHAQEMKCYFKDCVVFADGSRLCEVKEIPCPKEQ